MNGSTGEASRIVRKLALGAGFDRVGIARARALGKTAEGDRYRTWISEGRHGTMGWLARTPERRLDPGEPLAGARSVVCVALSYWWPEGEAAQPSGTGLIARYARGRDYHKVFTRRLRDLERDVADAFPGVRTRRYVDTGPVLEKLWAERAGLGWRGKHTNLVSRDAGSWLLLGEVLTDLELEPDRAGADSCGTCFRCGEACPTGAITGPYRLDANLCLSYLTIEHRGSIPERLRPALGDRVFGCDDCLEVCPWNRFAAAATEADLEPRSGFRAQLLQELVALDAEGFLRRFAGTPVMRARREGLARNACVALGNTGGPGAEDALGRALGDPSALVREHAAWALGRLGSSRARRHLAEALGREEDPGVRARLREAGDVRDGAG